MGTLPNSFKVFTQNLKKHKSYYDCINRDIKSVGITASIVSSLLWCLCSGEAYIAIGGESYIGGVGTQREK